MNEKELKTLIEKYQKGNCTLREKELIESYLNSFQNNENDWDTTILRDKTILEEKIFAKIERQIFNVRKKPSSLTKPNFIMRAAASLIFIFALSFAAYYLFFNENQKSVVEIEWNEKKTSAGEKSIITFLDGTKITLNADSKLKYSVDIETEFREVYLEGEAYFEVAENKGKPFIVHTGNLSTKVLGTKFNVKAFLDEKEFIVSLVEGSIKVSVNDNTEYTLTPSYQLIYNLKTQSQKVKPFELMQTIGWRDNILIFNDVSLEDALIKIERAYGVKFEFADESIKKFKIKANFENESIWTIIKVIKSATGLNYLTTMEEDRLQKVVFYKKSKI